VALEWTYSSEDVDWEELYRLYLVAPLGNESASDLKLGFAKSMFKCFAYDSGRLIAVGRALEIGRDTSYICGVAVHPDHQGLGVGREVMTRLITLSRGYKKITLHAASGREPFYRKLGFKRTGTTMTIFQDQLQALEDGLLVDEP
jgi:ribosomal protein S18 acetylase RimI-like enzyme